MAKTINFRKLSKLLAILFLSDPAFAFNVDVGSLLYGNLVKKPVMDALRFNIFTIKDLKNGKIVYLNDEYCQKYAQGNKWSYNSIGKATLSRCARGTQLKSHIKTKADFFSAALFLPNAGMFLIKLGERSLGYANHWRTDLKPKIKVKTDDPSLFLCVYIKDENKSTAKICDEKFVSSDSFFSFKVHMPKIAYINQEIGAYDFGTQSYENALKEMTGYGFPEGKRALDKIKSGKTLCDGEIIKKAEIHVTIELGEKSNFVLEGAYYLCPASERSTR